MRWLADECVDAPLVARLRHAGHDVVYAAEVAASATDSSILASAHNDGRLLLTEDKDFGELVIRLRRPVQGLVLLRTETTRHAHKWARLEAAIERYGERLFGRYTVVEDGRIRSRHLPGFEGR